ncbi:lactonase family protein [Microbacterium sp. NPDC055910]|uniref:lactonase family protein n=1 Tax=Microbacterium sp. NPDC055910 TaxID=3345659 RepID=UPI0035E02934
MRFLIGGYSPDKDGSATGIGMLLAGAADDHLAGGSLGYAGEVAATTSPSWVTAHPTLDVVYASLETRGLVQAFRRTGDATFAPLGEPVAAGDAVCHLAVSPDARFALASCWGDGRVVRIPLDGAGRPGTPRVLPPAVGSGPTVDADPDGIDLAAAGRALRAAAGEEFAHLVPAYDDREADATSEASDGRPSRAHQAVSLPGGAFATTDLGLDLVRFWQTDGSRLVPTQQVELPRGSGPRHAVWHPSGHLYVNTELSNEVYVLAWDPSLAQGRGRWRIAAGTPLGPTLETDTGAELAMSHDGGFLYAGVRGSDTIATLRVRGAGESLDPVALVEAGVVWPRHHLVVRDTLLVAGERSNDVASLTLDTRTGVPGRARHRTAAPSPTCILPIAG